MQPLVQSLPYALPETIAQVLCNAPWTCFLDGADKNHPNSNISIIALDPFATITDQPHQACPFATLKNLITPFQGETHNDLPAFQGGVIGYLSYEAGLPHNVDIHTQGKSPFPSWAFACYDCLIIFDHVKNNAWIASSGFPETINNKRLDRAKKRLNWMQQQYLIAFEQAQLAGIHTTTTHCSIQSNFTPATYKEMVRQAQRAILEGDLFEVNVAQRFYCQGKNDNNRDIYQSLRRYNPAPFAGLLQLPNDQAIASASPERFVRCHNGKVTTSPIKGTIAKSNTPQQDQINQHTLAHSEKDRAENIMIVDLLRNDLSQVCDPQSVTAPNICQLESFATVHHLVSKVEGQLLPAYDPIDLLQACFPGGSISGAPKIQAMKTIASLEPHQRGPYCGSLFCLGFDGYLDSNILIRTLCLDKDSISYHAGGAITLDSDPDDEYQESMDKAKALTQAIGAKA